MSGKGAYPAEPFPGSGGEGRDIACDNGNVRRIRIGGKGLELGKVSADVNFSRPGIGNQGGGKNSNRKFRNRKKR